MPGKSYGLPYKGTKNRIAEQIASVLPPAEYFIDLFAGGCAVSQAAADSGKYKQIIINDIDPVPVRTFLKAARGGYRDYNRWVSRKEFHETKATSGYARYCFSFGNDGMTYFCNPQIEPYYKAVFDAIFGRWEDWERLMPETYEHAKEATNRFELMSYLHRDVRTHDYVMNPLYAKLMGSVSSSEYIPRPLIYLNRLNQIHFDKPYTALSRDYRDVEIPGGAVVYCDIPYWGSDLRKCYGGVKSFDFEAFYDYCRASKVPVYVSEKFMPDDFDVVLETRRAGGNFSHNTYDTDRLYVWSGFR